MKEIEKTVDFFRLIESQDWHELSELLSDDFLYYGPMPDPFKKEAFLDTQRALQEAFPDWDYHISKLEKVDREVRVTVHITATHTNEFTLPIQGFKPLPATHRRIELPKEQGSLKFKNGKIKELCVKFVSHGGLPGLLEKLGLE